MALPSLNVHGAAATICSDENDPDVDGECELSLSDGWETTAGDGEDTDSLFFPIESKRLENVNGSALKASIL